MKEKIFALVVFRPLRPRCHWRILDWANYIDLVDGAKPSASVEWRKQQGAKITM